MEGKTEKFFGVATVDLDNSIKAEKIIIQNFRNNIVFEEIEGGAIKILVTHLDPYKASYYANRLMKKYVS